MKTPIMFVFLALGFIADVLAAERADHPPISFVIPGGGSSTVDRNQFVILVVEPGFISHDNNPVPSDGVITYVNNVLKAQGALYLGIHIRQGIKYGEVVRALDALRKTDAKSIGVSMAELPVGKDP